MLMPSQPMETPDVHISTFRYTRTKEVHHLYVLFSNIGSPYEIACLKIHNFSSCCYLFSYISVIATEKPNHKL